MYHIEHFYLQIIFKIDHYISQKSNIYFVSKRSRLFYQVLLNEYRNIFNKILYPYYIVLFVYFKIIFKLRFATNSLHHLREVGAIVAVKTICGNAVTGLFKHIYINVGTDNAAIV